MAISLWRDRILLRRRAPAAGFRLLTRPGDGQDAAKHSKHQAEAGEGACRSGVGQRSQLATPPWWEQVPRWCSLKLKLPSAQRAAAPAGALRE